MGRGCWGWPRLWQWGRDRGDRGTSRGQRDIFPCPLHAARIVLSPVPASVSLSPLVSAVAAIRHGGTPDRLGGVQPTLVTPAAPTDVAEVPWEGDTLQHPVFCTSVGRSSQECPSRASQVPLRGEGWVQAGPPSWVLTHRLPCPGPAPAPAGSGGLVLCLDRKTNEFHYGIAILFHVSGSLRLTCSPGCDKPRHPRARARARGLRMLTGHGAP